MMYGIYIYMISDREIFGYCKQNHLYRGGQTKAWRLVGLNVDYL